MSISSRRRPLIAALALASGLLSAPSMAHDYRNGMGIGYGYPPPNVPNINGPVMPPGSWSYPSLRGDRGVRSLRELARRLELDDKQQRRIEDILDEAFDRFRDIGEEMSANRRKIWRAVRDGKAYDSLAEKQGELLVQMIRQRATLYKNILAELDEDQRKRFKRMRWLGGNESFGYRY